MRRSRFLTWSELKVGVLVTVGLAVFLVAFFTLGGRAGVFADKYTLYTLMPGVSGLQKGAPVRLAGVDVGSVRGVHFIDAANRDSLDQRLLAAYGDSLGHRAVVIEFDINRSVQDKVTRSSRIKIGTVGLLGDKYLDIEVGDPRQPVLKEADIVLNDAPIDYEGLIARAAEGVEELVGSLEGARQLIASVNTGEGTLGRLIHDPQLYEEWLSLSHRGSSLLEKAQTGDGTLPDLLNDPQLYDQLVATTTDLQALTTSIREGEGTLGKMVRDPELYDRLIQTVRQGEQLIAEMHEGEGTVARLIRDPTLYERIDKFVVDSQSLIADIQENPRKYINLKVF